MVRRFWREGWDFGANGEQLNHWSIEKPPLERFMILDTCTFTSREYSWDRCKKADAQRHIRTLQDCNTRLHDMKAIQGLVTMTERSKEHVSRGKDFIESIRKKS